MEGNFNRHLGSKLRLRRLALGLTQTKVAQAINVTFQQIQKYEKGTNGISSLRIMQLGNILKVPVMYFFEDYPAYTEEVEAVIGHELGHIKHRDVHIMMFASVLPAIFFYIGFMFMVLLVIWAAASWGTPDLIDALIYYLSDGYYKN